MTSQCTAQLLADLGVTRSLSRPQVSDDNPFSEAQFKTLKYHPSFPGRFGDQGQAKTFCRSFFRWYNAEHRHGGISMLTPEQVHFGNADQVIAGRKSVLREAWAAHPERFVRGVPKPKPLPEAVFIKSSHPFPHHTGHCSLINPVECPIVVDRFRCGGIRTVEGKCPACGEPMPILEWTSVQMPDGTEYKVPPALVGGEGRYEDWVYLQMLEREWLRPITDADHFHSIAEGSRPSPRAIVVLVFWAYFETRIKRLIRETTMSLPKTVTKDLLQRYSSIGARLDRLYRVLFSTTYWTDLDDLGLLKCFSDPQTCAGMPKQICTRSP